MAGELIVKNGLRVSGSTIVSGSITATSFTGSFSGSITSASYAATASIASTASFFSGSISNATSASFASTASLAPLYTLVSVTSSMLAPYLLVTNTSSFATTTQLNSYLLISNTASMIAPYLLISNTGSMLSPYTPNSQTGSFVRNSQTGSFVVNSQTGSFVLNSFTSSMLAPYLLVTNTGSMLSPYTPNSQTGSFIRNSQTSSFYTGSFTGSFIGTSSFAATASRVNTLNQNVLITGSLTVGSTSLGANENTLVLGPAPGGGAGEGGQLLLAATGGTYTSASMLDTYQDSFRILRGTNAGSDAFKLKVDLHSGQVQIPNYNSPTAFTGTPVNSLATDNSGNILTVQGYSGIVTINTIPPVNFDIQNGIVVNVF